MKRWRVPEAQPLARALREVFAEPEALREGRVFVDRQRAQSAETLLQAGSWIELHPRRTEAHEAPRWLLQRGDWVALDKPSGMVTVPDHHGKHSLQAWVAEQLKLPLERVHPTSRLDREVSGVVVFALSAQARKSLQNARDQARYQRLYLALAAAPPEPESGQWRGAIGRAADPRKRQVGGRNAAPSSSGYQLLARAAHGALLALWPHTGRTHQLRVHCAHAGCALDGDASYRGRTRLTLTDGQVHTLGRIALHAHRVELQLGRETLRLIAPVPPALRTHWQRMGGSDDDWQLAQHTRDPAHPTHCPTEPAP